jgi:hypothetical protein
MLQKIDSFDILGELDRIMRKNFENVKLFVRTPIGILLTFAAAIAAWQSVEALAYYPPVEVIGRFIGAFALAGTFVAIGLQNAPW